METQQQKLYRYNDLWKTHRDDVVRMQKRLRAEVLPDVTQRFTLDKERLNKIEEYIDDEVTIFRFLKKSRFDQIQAQKKILAAIEWRINFNVDSVTLQTLPTSFFRKPLVHFHGHDVLNRPVVVCRLKHYPHVLKTKKKGEPLEDGEITADALEKMGIFCMELGRKFTLETTRRRERAGWERPLTTHFAVLLDMKDGRVFNLKLLPKQKSMQIYQSRLIPFALGLLDTYPSCVGSVYVLNYGPLYSTLWSIAKLVLPGKATSRILFADEAKMKEYIEEETLLQEFGGNNTTTYSPDTDPLLARHGGGPTGINTPACNEEEAVGEERWPMEINSLEPAVPMPKRSMFTRFSALRGREMEAA